MIYKSREVVIKLFNNYSSIVSEAKHKAKYGKGLKILTPKQMLQRLPIALAQVKTGNTSENLLNEIRQIIYSLYQPKEITKKVYNSIMNAIKNSYYFMNSKNSETSDPIRLSPNLLEKRNLKRSDRYIALSNLGIYYT